MTVQSVDSSPSLPGLDGSEAMRKAEGVERAQFPLALKLFLLTALLIVVVVLVAVLVTVQRANRIANDTVDASISRATRLFNEFERQRLGRLMLSAELVGSDPTFAAYIQNALSAGAPTPANGGPNPGTIDLVSIVDQLTQRKEAFGSDLVMLLDDQGRMIARTDQPALTTTHGEDLYEQTPLVRRVIDDATVDRATGVLFTAGKLYHAAVVPVGAGAAHIRAAYLVNAYAIDDVFANRISESTDAGVIFVPSPSITSTPTLARSSNAPSIGMQQMHGIEQIFQTGKTLPPSSVNLDRSAYLMTGQPLVAVNQVVGAAVFVRSLDRELLPFRQIENGLFLGGGAALMLAFFFSFLIAKRVTRPIEHLAVIAQAVTAGDYNVQPAVDSTDEVGILGRSFAKMITSLRDKAELEDLYQQMASRSEERESLIVRQSSSPRLEEGTVLVTDLRGLAPAAGAGDAVNVVATVTRAMKIQEAEVSRQDGLVREIVGQQLVSVFLGERSIIHAIRAARAINEELALQLGAASPASIGVGIANGEFVTGSVSLEHESGLAIVGNAPLLATIFAWHAPSGHAFISYETAQAAGAEVTSSVQKEEVRLRWLPQPLAVGSLPLASLTTGMMQSLGATPATVSTMRIDSTLHGVSGEGGLLTGTLEAGQLFAGRYRIEQILGRGGMGVVYKAVDTQLDEVVAIKTLPGDIMHKSREDLERFKREIRLARKITHRNVLRTYDYGEAEGLYFISMEYVRGYTLAELLDRSDRRQMAPRVAIGIARQICRALQAAHEQAIIHRDIKPQNVLIEHKGEVKLMDFGIARMAEAPEAMTQAGLIVGTPHYMSPEQVQGKQLDPRSDVYSIGVLLYEMLAGRRPFETPSLRGVLTAHITEKPRPVIELRPELGREINNMIMRCLEKDPKARYHDAGELLRDLDAIQLQQTAAA